MQPHANQGPSISTYSPACSTSGRNGKNRRAEQNAATESVVAEIASALHGLQFGHITVVVQDGVVVQIDRVEKRRICRRGN